MSEVISLRPLANIPEALRNIANAFEADEIEGKDCTVVIGEEVFHIGCIDDEQAKRDAIFNMTLGIHQLMNLFVSGD